MTNLNNLIIPTFDNKFEKFDIEYFEGNKSNDKSIFEDDQFYIEYLSQSTGYAKQIHLHESYIKLVKHYYQSGNIKSKGLMLVNGYPIETWYHFNEEGELIREENMDEGYDFVWKDVINYCIKNEIVLTKGYVKGGFQTTLYKQTLEGKKVWQITHRVSTNKIQELYLDGKSGKVIEKKTLDYRNS